MMPSFESDVVAEPAGLYPERPDFGTVPCMTAGRPHRKHGPEGYAARVAERTGADVVDPW
jgi:hypothetical protein